MLPVFSVTVNLLVDVDSLLQNKHLVVHEEFLTSVICLCFNDILESYMFDNKLRQVVLY